MCSTVAVMFHPNGLMKQELICPLSRTYGLVDLLGAYGPVGSLGVRPYLLLVVVV